MDTLVLDFESFYDKSYSLSSITTEEYIRHELFEVIGVSVKRNDEPAVWFSGTHLKTKEWLDQWEWDKSIAIAHNAMFDMAILNWHFGIKPKRIADTLGMGRALHGAEVGGSLKALTDYYDLGKKGDEVVRALGKGRIDFTDEELEAYGQYCINDVELTYKLFHAMLPSFPMEELKLVDLTTRMFTEPVLVLDESYLRAHLENVQNAKEALLSKAIVDKADLMSNDKFAALLRAANVNPPTKISPTTGKTTYAFAKTDQGMLDLQVHPNPMVQAMVAARLGTKSTLEETRTQRFIEIAQRGPLPVPLLYYGAHTGRWSGGDKINLQNLPRGAALKKAIYAPEGFAFCDADSSQIEARTLAWLAEQEDLVEFFEKNNVEIAQGVAKKDMQYDPYKIMAAEIYEKAVNDVADNERFVGKTTILGAGYGMGAPKFQGQLSNFKVVMPLEECERIIFVYRSTYPRIPMLWRQAQEALIAMMDGRSEPIGRAGILQVDGRNGIILPNGMRLKYPNLRWQEDPKTGKREIVYDQKKGRAIIPTRIYGGKCLGADTEVLTKRGWVRITEVTLEDRLWDGVEWVKHNGLIYQGDKSTIILNGVSMTPDHKVMTMDGWVDASSSEGLQRSAFRLPDRFAVFEEQRAQVNMDLSVRMREHNRTGSHRCSQVRQPRRSPVVWVQGGGAEQNSLYDKSSGILGVALNAGPMPIAFTSSMEELRCSGYQSMSTMGPVFRDFLGGYGTHIPKGTNFRPQRQRWGLYSSQLPVGNSRRTGAKPARVATCGPEKGCATNWHFKVNSGLSVAPEPVYDIRNAGPRTRFMVRGNDGPFIVHNCVENICQALARIIIGEQMLRIAKKYRVTMTVHDAVGSLIPVAEADRGREYVELCMRLRPSWAPDLPLNCESKIGRTYGG